MKKFYCFKINSSISLETAWDKLESHGIELAYGSEEKGSLLIYGYCEEDCLPILNTVLNITQTTLPSIDWESQWAIHGLNFKDGYVHVDLNQFGLPIQEVLRLCPGPGFGDLSHPTTRMSLSLMNRYIPNSTTVDIGCGSGILALAAAAMGSEAYGIDIDQQALNHSILNAEINRLEKFCSFVLPENFIFKSNKPLLIMMNMISSEQKFALQSLPQLHAIPGYRIVSGITKEERPDYLKWTESLGWVPEEEREETGWLAFVFKLKYLNS